MRPDFLLDHLRHPAPKHIHPHVALDHTSIKFKIPSVKEKVGQLFFVAPRFPG
jgi:hypothetical protein